MQRKISATRRRILAACAALPALSFAQQSSTFPTKPIRFIVPWGAGSGPDTSSRLFCGELSKHLGQQVVVENKPGAGSTIGTAIITKAPPDGYTIGHVGIGTAISNSVIANLPYELVRDCEMLVMMIFNPNLLAVRLGLPVNSVQELIALAKAKPGGLMYGSPGNGSSLHLGMELFKFMTGTQMVHVPYKDAQQAVTGLIGGQIDLLFDNMSSIAQHVRGGRIRGLAVTTPKRSPAFPELPTIAEAGVPGFEMMPWAGVAGPRGIPKDVVATLNGAMNKVLATDTVRERFQSMGSEAVGGTPEQFAAFVAKETTKWAEVVKRVGVRVD
jgi:tripartite-type tricarboxylate transporter receptor subunit TctC